MTQEEAKKRFQIPGLGLLEDLKEALSHIPSEESLNRFMDELPRLERIASRIEHAPDLGSLAHAFEDGTIERLTRFLPALRNLPTEQTLVDIIHLKPYLDNMPSSSDLQHLARLLERIPPPEQISKFVELLSDVRDFMKALKG